jgi:hypothetical protein
VENQGAVTRTRGVGPPFGAGILFSVAFLAVPAVQILLVLGGTVVFKGTMGVPGVAIGGAPRGRYQAQAIE